MTRTEIIQKYIDKLKAKKEELWLKNKFSDYHSYQLQVKKFIPWIY